METFNIGDKVKVPRTGGGYSLSTISAIGGERAFVTFPVGDTFHGNPVDPKDKEKMAYKNVALKNLIKVD